MKPKLIVSLIIVFIMGFTLFPERPVLRELESRTTLDSSVASRFLTFIEPLAVLTTIYAVLAGR